MENIGEMLKILKKVDQTRVKLFFLKRNKNRKTGLINYTLYKTKIHEDLRQEFLKTAKSQISKLEEKAETRDYTGIADSDQLIVQKIQCLEVPYFTKILDELRSSDLVFANKPQLNNIWAYVVQMQSPPFVVYLFKKYPYRPRYLKKTIRARGDGEIEMVNEPLITIFSDYDAAILSEATAPFIKPLLILNTSRFESLFSFFDYYKENIEQKRATFPLKDFLQSSDVLIDDCIDDSRKLKKICRITDEATFRKMTPDKLKKIIDDYHLNLKFTKEDKLVNDEENAWQVLRLLNDDYLQSACTDNQYEARSKLKLS